MQSLRGRKAPFDEQVAKDRAVANRYAEQMRSPTRTAEQYQEAKKKLANHEWYVHNRSAKQKYNKEYYENNKEYWQKRYLEAKGKMDKLERDSWHYMDELKSSRDKGDLAGAKQMREELDFTENQMGRLMPEERIAKENYMRAIREEQEFIDSHKKMPFSEAWTSGANDIARVGKAFMKKILKIGE